jgi:hypothetical protein
MCASYNNSEEVLQILYDSGDSDGSRVSASAVGKLLLFTLLPSGFTLQQFPYGWTIDVCKLETLQSINVKLNIACGTLTFVCKSYIEDLLATVEECGVTATTNASDGEEGGG